MPILNGKNFYLRTIKKADYLGIYEYGSDPEVTQFLSWGPFSRPSEAKWVIDNYYFPREAKGMPIGYAIIYRDNNKMIGTIDFHTINFKNNVGEIGYVLNREYQGMGIMTEALKLMVTIGFSIIKLNRIEIKHDTTNLASQRVIQKADFRYEGTARQEYFNYKKNCYMDVKIYSILKSEFEKGELKWQLPR